MDLSGIRGLSLVSSGITSENYEQNSVEYWRSRYQTKEIECAQTAAERDRATQRLQFLEGQLANLNSENERLRHAAEFMDTQMYRKREEIEKLLSKVAERHGGEVTHGDPCIPLSYRLAKAMNDSVYINSTSTSLRALPQPPAAIGYDNPSSSLPLPSWHQPAGSSGPATCSNDLPPSPSMPELTDETLPPPMSEAPAYQADEDSDHQSDNEALPEDRTSNDSADMDETPQANDDESNSEQLVVDVPPPKRKGRAPKRSSTGRKKSVNKRKSKESQSAPTPRRSRKKKSPALLVPEEPESTSTRKRRRSGRQEASKKQKQTAVEANVPADDVAPKKKGRRGRDYSFVTEDEWQPTDLRGMLSWRDESLTTSVKTVYKCTNCTPPVFYSYARGRTHFKNNHRDVSGSPTFNCTRPGCSHREGNYEALIVHMSEAHGNTSSAHVEHVTDHSDHEQAVGSDQEL